MEEAEELRGGLKEGKVRGLGGKRKGPPGGVGGR